MRLSSASIWGVSPTRKSLPSASYSASARAAPSTMLRGAKSPPIASTAIFMAAAGPAGAGRRFALRLDGQHLASAVIAAGWASRVTGHAGAALAAGGKLRRVPAVGRPAGALAHLGCLAFGNSHKICSSVGECWLGDVESIEFPPHGGPRW